MLENQQGLQGRQYFLDWLRVLAFGYLIFYHAAMMFVGWGFHVVSGDESELLKYIMTVSHVWRIALLFLVSGVAISFMTRKTPKKAFAKERGVRLGIPFLFALFVVVAPQSYFEALQKGFIEVGFFDFFPAVFWSFTWVEGMDGPFPVYNHMWYVLYLLIYTIVLLPLFYYFNTEAGQNRMARCEVWLVKGYRLFWLPLAAFTLSKVTLGAYFDETHALFDDWWIHADSMMLVMLGFVFVRMPSVWARFEVMRLPMLVLAISSALFYDAVVYAPDAYLPLPGNTLYPWVFAIVKWSWIAMLLGYARHYLNKPSEFLCKTNKAIYPFFILHQTVTIVIGYYIIQWNLGLGIELSLIIVGTFVICWALYAGLIRHFNLMRLLFGMRPKT